MDRKGMIAIAIALVTLVAWQLYYQREMGNYTQAKRAADAAAAAQKALVTPAAPALEPGAPTLNAAAPAVAVVPAAPTAPTAPVAPVVPEETRRLATPAIDYSFTNQGGGIARVSLTKHQAEKGSRVVLNEFGKIPIGAIVEKPGEETRAIFTIASEQGSEITYQRDDARGVRLSKRYILPTTTDRRAEYIARLEVTFTNTSAAPLTLPGYFVHGGGIAPVHQNDMEAYSGVARQAAGSHAIRYVSSFSTGGLVFGLGSTDAPVILEPFPTASVQWAGVANQYFTSIVTPLKPVAAPLAPVVPDAGAPGSPPSLGMAVWSRRMDVSLDEWKAADRKVLDTKTKIRGAEVAVGMPGFTLAPAATATQAFEIYTGPREHGRLALLGADQEDIMDFGIFEPVSWVLLNSMNGLHAWFGSYALAIIVLTLIIKSILWFPQNKATQSMKRMSALQPKMAELKEKFKDDPQRQNSELMKLYKDYGVNPFGGCLPMLIQIPIFFGFYNMLGKAVELRNSGFLWVDDLSMPDTVAHIPVIGIAINILPLIMAGTMFWQMAISPKSGDPVQQRVFMFMPLIFVFFCYTFASALALYWTVQNLFSVVQLYLTRNAPLPVLEKKIVPTAKKAKAR